MALMSEAAVSVPSPGRARSAEAPPVPTPALTPTPAPTPELTHTLVGVLTTVLIMGTLVTLTVGRLVMKI